MWGCPQNSHLRPLEDSRSSWGPPGSSPDPCRRQQDPLNPAEDPLDPTRISLFLDTCSSLDRDKFGRRMERTMLHPSIAGGRQQPWGIKTQPERIVPASRRTHRKQPYVFDALLLDAYLFLPWFLIG